MLCGNQLLVLSTPPKPERTGFHVRCLLSSGWLRSELGKLTERFCPSSATDRASLEYCHQLRAGLPSKGCEVSSCYCHSDVDTLRSRPLPEGLAVSPGPAVPLQARRGGEGREDSRTASCSCYKFVLCLQRPSSPGTKEYGMGISPPQRVPEFRN